MNPPRVPADPTPAMAHGGTFVRPGAFAWGRPRPHQRDDASPAAHSAIIEDAVAVAAKDPDRVTDLLDELRRARLWLPLPDDDGPVTDGCAVQLPTVTYLGAEFVPAFTSAERMVAWPLGSLVPPPAGSLSGGARGSSFPRGSGGMGPSGPGEQQSQPAPVPHIVVPAVELARLLPPGVGIALNPGAETSVPVYPEGIGYLCGDIRVGHPPADPLALLGQVRTGLKSVPEVRHASRAWLSVPGAGEGLVISVTLRDPACEAAHHAVIEAIEGAAAVVPHQFPIDVTFPGEGAPDQVDDWISRYAEPFYVSAVSASAADGLVAPQRRHPDQPGQHVQRESYSG